MLLSVTLCIRRCRVFGSNIRERITHGIDHIVPFVQPQRKAQVEKKLKTNNEDSTLSTALGGTHLTTDMMMDRTCLNFLADGPYELHKFKQTLSATRVLLLQSPSNGIPDQCESTAKINAHIATVRSEFRGDGTNVPDLRHARKPTSQVTCQKSGHGSNTEGQLFGIVPAHEIVTIMASEPFIFEK